MGRGATFPTWPAAALRFVSLVELHLRSSLSLEAGGAPGHGPLSLLLASLLSRSTGRLYSPVSILCAHKASPAWRATGVY